LHAKIPYVTLHSLWEFRKYWLMCIHIYFQNECFKYLSL